MRLFKVDPTTGILAWVITALFSLGIGNVVPESIVEDLSFWDKVLFYLYKKTMDFNLNLATIIILCWLIFAIFHAIYSQKIDIKEDENKKLKIELKEVRNDLKIDAGKLLSRYSDLTKFKIKDVLNESIKKFTDSKYIIESAQLYKYTYIPSKDDTIIRVQYSGGYVKEQININSIMQSYYTIPTYILEDLNSLINLYKKIRSDTEINSVIEEFIFAIFDLIDEIGIRVIKDIKHQIESKDNRGLQDEEADLYAILRTVISMLYENEDDAENNGDEKEDKFRLIDNKLSQDDDIEKELRLKKRTGILEAILRKDYAIFQHEGMSDKKGRAYISKCLSLNEEKFVLLISSNPLISEDYDWKNNLLDICCELEGILKSTFAT